MTGVVSDGPVTWTCDAWREMAAEVLDHREPSHPGIVEFALHMQDDWNRDFFPDGPPIYGVGPPQIMVMKLDDGSLRAVAIQCSPGGCGASDDPPLKPGETATLCHPDTTKYNQCEEIISVARAELEVVQPDHPEILNTLLDTKNDQAQYLVEFYTADGLLGDVAVDCTEQGCAIGLSSP